MIDLMIPRQPQIRFLCANRRPFFNLSRFISMDPTYAGPCNPYIIPSDDCKGLTSGHQGCLPLRGDHGRKQSSSNDLVEALVGKWMKFNTGLICHPNQRGEMSMRIYWMVP